MSPKWSKGYSRLGLAKFKAGDLAGSIKAYTSGLAQDPDNTQIADGLAEAKAAKKREVEAAVQRAQLEAAAGALTGGDRFVIGIDLGTTCAPRLAGNSSSHPPPATPAWPCGATARRRC